MGHSY